MDNISISYYSIKNQKMKLKGQWLSIISLTNNTL